MIGNYICLVKDLAKKRTGPWICFANFIFFCRTPLDDLFQLAWKQFFTNISKTKNT